VTAFRAIVLEHFKRPRNRGALEGATVSEDGANALCGDRIRIELRVDGGVITQAKFTADACALSIASASVLTEHVTGMPIEDARAVEPDWIAVALDGEPPPGSVKCARLPLDTLRRALSRIGSSGT
jgi:nitrogen fixation NifU-like protein